ncbi:MAG: substrate-binding domain-containing protein [Bacteroidales bacterium]|jgi:phosphate transport system substrate-binding protein|nr:substrate-binding domain-containing protein [Bacteroidales bacterium]
MKIKNARLLFLLVPVLFLSGTVILPSCNNQGNESRSVKGDSLKGKITISGAFALYPLVVKWAEEFQKLHPKLTINVSAGGAGKGMADALSKMVDLGMYSKSVSPEEQAKGAWWIAVAKDAVLPTINAANPVMKDLKKKGLTRQKFYDIFISGKITTWGEAVGNSNALALQAFTRSDACGAADMWAKYLKGKKQEDLQGLGVNGDPGVADAVRKNIEGIGFNNLGFVYEMKTRKIYPGLDVVPIDLNENGIIDSTENFYATMDRVMKAIDEGIYPSPPARELYLVSGGKPVNKLVIAFLQWILNDGQKFVNEAGYVMISPDKIKAEMLKLN